MEHPNGHDADKVETDNTLLEQQRLEIESLKKQLRAEQENQSKVQFQLNTILKQISGLYQVKNPEEQDLDVFRSLHLIKVIVNSIENKKDTIYQHIHALDASNEGISIINDRGKIIYSNKTFKKLLGVEDEALDIHWSQLFPKEHHMGILKRITQLSVSQDCIEGEVTLTNKAFRKLTLSYSLSFIDKEHFLCNIKDITEQKEYVNKIEEQATLIKSASDFIGITNERFEFTFLNSSAQKLIKSKDSIINFLNIICDDSKTEYENNIRYELEFKNKWKGELNLKINGELVPIYCEILNYAKEISKEVGHYIIIQDIRERKKAIQKLVDAKNLAEKNVEIRQQFLANMSHEIRTPMNAIIGLANLLNDSKLTNKQKEFVESIKLSGENLLVILNDILDISKIESGKLSIENVPFKLYELTETIRKTFEHKVREKNIDLVIDIPANLPTLLKGDPTRLNQILINLVNNAIKFTEKGFVKFSVSKVFVNEETTRLKFIIQDSGIGISKEKQDQIFEPFTQEKQDTTRKYGGTGLGLTIVRQLVQLLNGRVELKSEMDIGSTFIVEIDFEIADSMGKNQKSFNQNFENSKLKSANILMAEDYPMNQLLAKGLFEKWGLNLDIVNNGKEALDALENKNYSLVLMDIQMPEMDGLECTRQIRSQGISTPIIAITAHAFKEEKEKCFEAGMHDFISKPFQEEELMDKLVHFINMKEEDLKELIKIEQPAVNSVNEDSNDFIKNADLLFDEVYKAYGIENEIKASNFLGVIANGIESIGNKDFAETVRKTMIKLHQISFEELEALINQAKMVINEFSTYQQSQTPISKPAVEKSKDLHIDLSEIVSIANSNPSFGKNMIDLYKSQSTEQLEKLTNAVANENLDQIRKIVHSMKASFGMLKCKVLIELSKHIEAKIYHGNITLDDIMPDVNNFIELTNNSFDLVELEAKKIGLA